MNQQPIVVGIDGSAGARRAAWWGAKEAARRHAPLLLVHGYGIPDAFYSETAPPQEWLAEKERQSRDWLAEAAEVAGRADDRAEVSTGSFLDAGVPLLISKSDSAMMAVVGFTMRSVMGGLVMGSTATSLAAHGHCPVAVVRGRDGRLIGDDAPVVVGADGSPAAAAAIGLAFEEAALRGVPLVTLHAHEGHEPVSGVLDAALAPWREKYPEVTLRQVTTRDDPRKQLLDWSGRAQLVVVGRRGRGGFTGLVLGSTSHAMIHHAQCPVLVTRSELGR
jgi:nucleotide-binding universal stress UspA family protein